MNINSPYQLRFNAVNFINQKIREQSKEQPKEKKEKIKERAQTDEAELKQQKRTDRQEANHAFLERLKETSGDKSNDKQLQHIMEKFSAGQKLTPQELAYVAARDPEGYKHVAEVTQRREALEQQMKAAKTKGGATQAYAITLQIASKTSSAPDEVLTNHLNSAYNEYTNSREFLRKPTETELADEETKLAKVEFAPTKKMVKGGSGIKSFWELIDKEEKDIEEAKKIRAKRKKRAEKDYDYKSESEKALLPKSVTDMAKALNFSLDLKA